MKQGHKRLCKVMEVIRYQECIWLMETKLCNRVKDISQISRQNQNALKCKHQICQIRSEFPSTQDNTGKVGVLLICVTLPVDISRCGISRMDTCRENLKLGCQYVHFYPFIFCSVWDIELQRDINKWFRVFVSQCVVGLITLILSWKRMLQR